KQYDGNTTAMVDFTGASLAVVVSGDAVSINSSSYSASFATKTVANTKAVTVTGVTLSGADAGNYTVSQPTGLTADITARTLTISGAVADNKAVTVTGVSLSGADAGNYTVSQPTGLTADITARALTINGALAQNLQYDGKTAAMVDFTGASLAVVVSGDAVTINHSGYSAS